MGPGEGDAEIARGGRNAGGKLRLGHVRERGDLGLQRPEHDGGAGARPGAERLAERVELPLRFPKADDRRSLRRAGVLQRLCGTGQLALHPEHDLALGRTACSCL
ncbi:MAG: hypothetical protein ACK55I_50455, partial [bacterium]